MADRPPAVDAARILDREERFLAPYAMRSRSTLGRRHEETPSPYRTCFQRDRDRIIHSTAFRRLEYKTQVFVNHEGDHYRTRLTHTLEVAQISRSIARALGLNEDLVEAIALAHDLGHPPFGHSGEEALDELMGERGGFNHNAQSLRVIDELEKRYPEYEGLNLSWEIRESTIKHGEHFGPDDLDPEFRPGWSPLLEAQLADVADSLAYTSHDIDDGLRAGFLDIEDLRQVRLWQEAEEVVRGRYGGLERKTLVARVVSRIIDRQVEDIVESTLERLGRLAVDSPEAVRSHRGQLVGFSDGMEAPIREMGEFLTDRLYRHYRTLKMAEKAKRFVRELFREYLRCPAQLPPAFRDLARRETTHRAICDYVAGMTDRYCQEEYQRMFHPFEKL